MRLCYNNLACFQLVDGSSVYRSQEGATCLLTGQPTPNSYRHHMHTPKSSSWPHICPPPPFPPPRASSPG